MIIDITGFSISGLSLNCFKYLISMDYIFNSNSVYLSFAILVFYFSYILIKKFYPNSVQMKNLSNVNIVQKQLET